jgi:hypothetical protein
MSGVWRNTLAAMAIALGAQGVAAQSVTEVNGLKEETAARQAMDENILSIVGQLTETNIVGRWSMSGTTSCLQSSNGFNANFSPLIPTTGTTFVSQLAGTIIGTRTFNADGTGRSVATSHSMSFPGTFHGVGFPAGVGSGPAGGASVAPLDAGFTWSIQPDGTLRIDDDDTIPQTFTAPPFRVGSTVTIEDVPPFVGHISKDRRTITLTHPGMSIETSVFLDGLTGAVTRTPRFCARHRVLTRLPD